LINNFYKTAYVPVPLLYILYIINIKMNFTIIKTTKVIIILTYMVCKLTLHIYIGTISILVKNVTNISFSLGTDRDKQKIIIVLQNWGFLKRFYLVCEHVVHWKEFLRYLEMYFDSRANCISWHFISIQFCINIYA